MSDEKKIRGIIQSWTTPEVTKNNKYSVSCKINNNNYRFFCETFEDAELWKNDKPIGSKVEFDQYRSGNYWNFKQGSFKMISIGDGKPPQNTPQATKNNTSPSKWKQGQGSDMSKKDWLEKEQRDIRVRCLEAAVKISGEYHMVLETAKALEQYVWEGYEESMPIKTKLQSQPVPVENI